MPTWPRTLRQAGITDPDLHTAYTRQSKLVRRFKTEEYLTVRLLLPTHLHPPVIAAVAFMHETDTRIDTGTTDARTTALGEWATATRQALAGAPVTDVTLSVLRDAVSRHPQLAPRTEAFLQAAHHEVNYSGFGTEEELQAYVEGYSLPAFMLLACLLERDTSADALAFDRGCRDLIEAMQRVDFLDDLAEDAAHGQIGIPREELDRHGLSVENLLEPTDAVRARLEELVREQAALARRRLSASRHLVHAVARQTRPFITALLQVQKLRLSAVSKKGGRLADGGARPSVPSLLGVLAHQYGAARRLR
ncbi:squalene/phytoene synthase family protein (plasmid) [Streptomyces sp. NBC_00015]|uniref:phytoene/squalene synthase family protein n=1 Tax=Streptomyces sp. NBC_00015 TaxID=2903611 RepID=UPI002F90C795